MRKLEKFMRFLVGLLLGLASLAIYWVVQSGLSLIFGFVLGIYLKNENPKLTQQEFIDSYNSYIFLLLIIGAAITLALLSLGFKLIKKSFSEYCLIKRLDGKLLLLAYFLGVFLNSLTLAIIAMIPVPVKWLEKNAESTALYGNELIFIFATFVAAPIIEEVIFRGLFYKTLKNRGTLWFAVIASSALFGVFHGNYLQAIYAGAMGLFCVVVYELTGSLLAPILLHMGYNSSGLILYFLGIYKLKTSIIFSISVIIISSLLFLLIYLTQINTSWKREYY